MPFSLPRCITQLLTVAVLLPTASLTAIARDDEDAPAFKLVVSDAPQSAAAGDTRKTREDRVKEQIAHLQQRGYLKRGADAALGADREITIPLLRKVSGTETKAGRGALKALMDLKDPEARSQWFAAMIKADSASFEDLQWLSTSDDGTNRLLPRNPEEEKALRAKLQADFNPQLAFSLIELPWVADLLIDKLPSLGREDQWWVAKVLAGHKLKPDLAKKHFAWVRAQAGTPLEEDLKNLVEVVATVASGGGELGAEAEQLALGLLKKKPDLVVQEQGIARDYAHGATKASRELLERMVKDSRDPVIRAYALAAIARQDGPAVLETFASEMRRSGSETWDVLQTLAENGHRAAADAYVLKHLPTLDRNGVGYALRHGGPEVMERAVKSAPKLDKDLQFEIAWKTRNHRVETFFTRLKEQELVPRLPTADEIKKAREGDDREPRLEASAAMGLLEIVGGVFTFDSEADEIPPRYDELLTAVSQFTRGAFAVDRLRQASPKSKVAGDGDEEEEELGPAINVKFVSGGKLFDLTPARVADWFDVGAVQATVNRALEVAGRKERLLPLDGWSQEASFVFGPPEAWQKIAAEFAFPINTRSSAAEKGRDYERHVIETLKGRDKK